MCLFFFFINTAPTENYTLSLHDALPIFTRFTSHEFDVLLEIEVARRPDPDRVRSGMTPAQDEASVGARASAVVQDRKSTRLNSSHSQISYAVFCLKKKKSSSNNDKIIHY